MDVEKLATKIAELTGLQARAMPGSEVWIYTDDQREFHAWADGEWRVHEWGGDGVAPVPVGSSCLTTVSQDSEDVDVAASAIADCVAAVLER